MGFPEWDMVTDQNWDFMLPQILQDISDCTFVALDFEFSGIPAHQPRASRRQSLQERYAEVKEVARTYQILQVGLTIVQEDPVAGKYTLQPYNIQLSPLIDPSLRIDRTFGFSSGAVQFLLKSGFNLDTPFKEGVPYLSKTEEEQILEDARQHHNSRSQTAKRAQIVLSEGDVESAAFLAEVRKDIQEWLDVGWEKQDSLNVPSWNATSTNGRSAVTSLNRFQKRLVHQLIESEFPTLTSIGCSDFIRIVKYDKEREDKIFEEKMNRVERRVIDHRGFRWIIEALAGGDLTQMTTEMFEPSAGIVDEEEPAVVRKRIIDQIKLKNGRIPVVGHNLFMDIIYLFQCFYGGLPDRVEDFARFLHKKFPMLIDTKYIFTHDCGDMNPVASLDDISMACEKITKPKIRIDMKHERYQNKAYPHEAGYDSLLTAQNFIKLAVQLPGARSKASRQSSKATRMQHTGSLAAQHTGGINPDVSKTTSTSNKGHSTTNSHSKFASKNVYDTLWPFVSDTMGLETEMGNLAVADAGAELIPSFSSPVWKVYGNNLRVFGTHEKVFKLVA